MPSTYSSNLKIELQANGENAATWGTITNANLGTALEQAIVGYATANYTSDATLTLTYTDTNAAQTARALVLNVTSGVSLSTTRELVVPTIQKQYIVQNNTTGSQSITVKTAAGSGITIPNGRKAHLYVDGTNVIQMFDTFSTLTLSGGTANGVAYLNASKAVTSGSALVFDGANLGIGTASPAQKLHLVGNAYRQNDATGSFGYQITTTSATTTLATLFGGSSFAIQTNGSGTNQFLVDSSGNIGLGVTPSAWDAGSTVLETGNQVSYSRYGYVRNAYVSGGVYKYTTSAVASYYQQSGGNHLFYIAPSGTAGNTVSFTQAATINASGNFGIGTTAPSYRIDAQRDSYGIVAAFRMYDGTNNPRLFIYGNSSGSVIQHTFSTGAGNLMFTNGGAEGAGDEIMRLQNGGNVGIGTTSPQHRLVVSNSGANGFEFVPASGIFQTYNRSTSAYTNLRFDALEVLFATGSSPAERIRFTTTGQIGVGTSSPGTRVQISNNAGLSGGFSHTDGTSTSNLFVASGVAKFGASTNSPVAILTNNIDRVFIDTSGRVNAGINVNSSAFVAANGLMTAGAHGSSGTAFAIANTSTASSSNVARMGFFPNSETYESATISVENPNATSGAGGTLIFGVQGIGGSSSPPDERMRITDDGHALIGTSSVAGDYTNNRRVMGGIFATRRNENVVANNTTTTIDYFPSGDGNYLVTVSLSGSGAPATYNEVAVVRVSSSTSSVTVLSDGTSITISTSGLDLRVLHTFGSAQTIKHSIIRLL